MRFSHIEIENWRNFGHVDIDVANRAFLVGPNASGKSNFLDALRFLRDIVTPGGGFEQAVESRGGVSRIRNLAARRNPDIVIRVTLADKDEPDWSYTIAFGQDARHPVLKEEQIWCGDKLLLSRPDQADEKDPARLRQTLLEQTFANAEFRAIAEFFGSIRYYHIVPQLVRDPDRSTGRRNDPYGGDFLEQISATSPRTREARLRKISGVLKVAVPQLQGFKIDKDSAGVPHLYGNYQHWRPQGAWQTEVDFSDGTLRLLGLLWAILDGLGPVLMEEPELSLHPAIVRRIPQMMLQAQKQSNRAARQVFISTHSSDLLSDEGISADEVLLVRPSEDGSTIQIGAHIEEVVTQLQAGLTVAEAVMPRTTPQGLEELPLFDRGR